MNALVVDVYVCDVLGVRDGIVTAIRCPVCGDKFVKGEVVADTMIDRLDMMKTTVHLSHILSEVRVRAFSKDGKSLVLE